MNKHQPTHTRELGIILFPATDGEWTYVNTLARKYPHFFSHPVRCTYTSVPANAVGLLFVARLQNRLGKERVIVKCVNRSLISSDIPRVVRKFITKDRNLTKKSMARLLSKSVRL